MFVHNESGFICFRDFQGNFTRIFCKITTLANRSNLFIEKKNYFEITVKYFMKFLKIYLFKFLKLFDAYEPCKQLTQ